MPAKKFFGIPVPRLAPAQFVSDSSPEMRERMVGAAVRHIKRAAHDDRAAAKGIMRELRISREEADVLIEAAYNEGDHFHRE